METELRNPTAIEDWAETIIHEAQHALDRMDTTLTLTEAKIALLRRLRTRREELALAEMG
jgi:hypothetical protein